MVVLYPIFTQGKHHSIKLRKRRSAKLSVWHSLAKPAKCQTEALLLNLTALRVSTGAYPYGMIFYFSGMEIAIYINEPLTYKNIRIKKTGGGT